MKLIEAKALDIGDEVDWVDPDAGACSAKFRIIEIVTESGLIEDMDSVVVLSDSNGACTEAYVSELN